MFIDRVKLQCVAGKGGNGAIAWRREKFIPKGGPSGGNGGKGGSIIFKVDHNVYSLDWFSHRSMVRAQDGKGGSGGCKKGKNGPDLILKVPPGTLVKDAKTGEVLFDFVTPGTEVTLCQGGTGGRGNFSFRSSTNRAPNKATFGKEGEIKEIELELKLIADVGFVGFPNSGKSTLISGLTHVRVKIAPYPFTTLRPNLGYIYYEDSSRVLLADIPGIIHGAHKNKGLGFEFLRHIERTSVLIYVIDIAGSEGRDPLEDFSTLQQELKKYSPELLKRPYLIALNKSDLEGAQEHIQAFMKKHKKQIPHIRVISAEKREGLDQLKGDIYALVH
jgi:GTP-binding protein